MVSEHAPKPPASPAPKLPLLLAAFRRRSQLTEVAVRVVLTLPPILDELLGPTSQGTRCLIICLKVPVKGDSAPKAGFQEQLCSTYEAPVKIVPGHIDQHAPAFVF